MLDFVWTIILALILGVGGNLLTPFVSKILGKYFSTYKERNEKKRSIFEKSVQYILDNPLEEINLRIGALLNYVICMITWTMSLIAATLMQTENIFIGIMGLVLSISMLIVGFVFLRAARKYSSIVHDAWRRRKKEFPEIDLD